MSCKYANRLLNAFTSYIAIKHIPQRFNPNRRFNLQKFLPYSTAPPTASINTSNLSKYLKEASKFISSDIDSILTLDDISNSPQWQRNILLRCCGKSVPNKSLDYRIRLCDVIFDQFRLKNTEDYNTYIKVNTENETLIDVEVFLERMKCEADEQTFKSLLENVCQRGDTAAAYKILSHIKERGYSADECVFNNLILCHTINEGYKGADVVLNTMKAAQIARTSDTNWNILMGLAIRGDEEFERVLKTLSVTLNEQYFLNLLLKLGLRKEEELINIVMSRFQIEDASKSFISEIEHMCVHLIHRNRAKVAVQIFCRFFKAKEEERVKILLAEMLETATGTEEIVGYCKHFELTERFDNALIWATGLALKTNQTERALTFLRHFQELRPHYFWPILFKAGRENGEIGVLSVLEKMTESSVEIDHETMELYVLPFCDLSHAKSFLKRVHRLKLTMRLLLTPMIRLLLRNGHIKESIELYNEYKVPVDSSRLTQALAIAWKDVKDINLTIEMLKAICESDENSSSRDFTGNFLVRALRLCLVGKDYVDFLDLAKVLRKERLSITAGSCEMMEVALRRRDKSDLRREIDDALYKLTDVSINSDEAIIPHPKNMSVDELECHLIELTNKGMETRGVLRRLTQAHTRLGNYARVEELRAILKKSGYEESAGMKAGLLQTIIKKRDSEEALRIYREIRRQHPGFDVDEYKLVDLAALLVEMGKYDVAMELLKDEYNDKSARGGISIERNCINLLLAAKNPQEARGLFEYLTERNFCAPKNTILGAVLRSYLKSNDLENATSSYEHCCKRYRCTPLQVELLKEIVNVQDEKQLSRALDATAGVYGVTKAKMSLAVVFADAGLKNPLAKLLSEMSHVPDPELRNRCDQWVRDNRLRSLLTLAEAASRIAPKVLNSEIVYYAILQLYDARNDVKGASEFLERLKEDDVIISTRLVRMVENLYRRNNLRETTDKK